MEEFLINGNYNQWFTKEKEQRLHVSILSPQRKLNIDINPSTSRNITLIKDFSLLETFFENVYKYFFLILLISIFIKALPEERVIKLPSVRSCFYWWTKMGCWRKFTQPKVPLSLKGFFTSLRYFRKCLLPLSVNFAFILHKCRSIIFICIYIYVYIKEKKSFSLIKTLGQSYSTMFDSSLA